MSEEDIQCVTLEEAESSLKKEETNLGDFVLSTYPVPGAVNRSLALSVKWDRLGSVRHFMVYKTFQKSEYFIWPWAVRFQNVTHLLEYYKINNIMRCSNGVLANHCLVQSVESIDQLEEEFLNNFPGKVFEKIVKREGYQANSEIFVQKGNQTAGLSVKVFSYFGENNEGSLGLKPLIPKINSKHAKLFENIKHFRENEKNELKNKFNVSNSFLLLLKRIFFNDILTFFREFLLVFVLGMLLYVFDYGSDTFLAVCFLHQGDYVWGSLTLFLIFLPGWMRAIYSVGKSLHLLCRKKQKFRRRKSDEEMGLQLIETNNDSKDCQQLSDPFYFDLGIEVFDYKIPIQNWIWVIVLVPLYIIVMGPSFAMLVLYQHFKLTKGIFRKFQMKLLLGKVQYQTKKLSEKEISDIVNQYYSKRTVDPTEEIQLKIALKSITMNSEVFDKHIQRIIDKFSENFTNNEEELEKRKFDALKTKSLDAVFESFPQLLLQMYILLKSFSTMDTFEISQANIRSLVSISFSFLSLVKTAIDLHEYDRNKHKKLHNQNPLLGTS